MLVANMHSLTVARYCNHTGMSEACLVAWRRVGRERHGENKGGMNGNYVAEGTIACAWECMVRAMMRES